MRDRLRRSAVLGLLALAGMAVAPRLEAADAARLQALARSRDTRAIRALGPGVMPELARLYTRSEPADRAAIASVFYELGWKSAEAKQALLADIRTTDQALRLQVQWALGRVSGDPDVVDVLLDNMRNDAVPLFRDKAACALASDQIHLAPAEKARLLQGLIDALEDPKPQVRQIALQALLIQTGQTKGFVPTGLESQRKQAIVEWRRWLVEYRSQL